MPTVMQILSPLAIKEYETPPKLLWRDRRRLLIFPDDVNTIVQQIRQPHNKAVFILQYLYFRVAGRFYTPEQFRKRDIKVLSRQFNINEEKLRSIRKATISNHRTIICELMGFRRNNYDSQKTLKERAEALCEKQKHPRFIFGSLIDFLNEQKIEGFPYHTLASIITESFNTFKDRVVTSLNNVLSMTQKLELDNLISTNDGTVAELNDLSVFNHSRQLKSIQENCNKLDKIQNIANDLIPIVKMLKITPEVIDYYARAAQSFQPLQLARRGHDRYLYLFCAIIHLNRYFQDELVESLLLNCRSNENGVSKRVKERAEEDLKLHRIAMKSVILQAESSKQTLEKIESIVQDTSLNSSTIVSEIREIYRIRKTKNVEIPIPIPEVNYRDQCIEEASGKLKQRIAATLKLIQFDIEHSDVELIEAINFFLTHERITSKAPLQFLTEEQRDSVIRDKKINVKLYRGYLFYAIANALRSGRLNLKESYKFQAFEDYLISSNRWTQQKGQLLNNLNMKELSSVKVVLNQLQQQHTSQNIKTQDRLNQEKNPNLRIDSKGKVSVKTPPVQVVENPSPSAFMPTNSSVPLFQILSTIESVTGFTSDMEHLYQKSVKKRPSKAALLSALIGYGCNLGVDRMSRMVRNVQGVDVNYAARWFLSVDSIQAANNAIIALTDKIKLSTLYYRTQGKKHTSSDGQKFVVGIDSIHASYSHKYFGTQKGISAYTFIDEAHKLFHSTVITPSEREAAYVIDGLMSNDVIQSDIHSTDTHGYSEIVFAVSHLLGISFAPRIKNVKKQRCYSFEKPSIANKEGYKIQSSGRIKSELIEAQWEEILRFIATIKSKEQTASQLFKRLNSYSRQHPLYRALKQFGRIIKSIFLLQYIDDLELRQAIEKQLNKVESYHQFSKAIFFGGNQEFNYASREEQLLAEGCKRLVANAIICWNYLFLAKKIATAESPDEKREIVNAVKTGSVVTWQHVNFHGEYDLSDQSLQGAEEFDLEEIMYIDIEDFM